ncbi:MAG: hypothetical protein NTW78_05825 [Campylobacterales bacterium]|nr:hypothetical protein [Campylobacterales bacterium]
MIFEDKMKTLFEKFNIDTNIFTINNDETKIEVVHQLLAQVFNNPEILTNEDKKDICEFINHYQGYKVIRSKYFDYPSMKNCQEII